MVFSHEYPHTLVIGGCRRGKTSTIIKPLVYELLLAKKRGVELGEGKWKKFIHTIK